MTTILGELVIQSGEDWSAPLTLYQADGTTPLEITTPVMEIRRDVTSTSQLLARLDTTNMADGMILPTTAGHWTLALPHTFTETMPWGRGFWQVFAYIDTRRRKVASGIVNILPRTVAS